MFHDAPKVEEEYNTITTLLIKQDKAAFTRFSRYWNHGPPIQICGVWYRSDNHCPIIVDSGGGFEEIGYKTSLLSPLNLLKSPIRQIVYRVSLLRPTAGRERMENSITGSHRGYSAYTLYNKGHISNVKNVKNI